MTLHNIQSHQTRLLWLAVVTGFVVGVLITYGVLR